MVKKDFLPFEEARIFVRRLKMKSHSEWIKYCKSGKRPNNIPSNPGNIYKDKGWNGMRDYLGNTLLPFEEARIIARKLKITSQEEWVEYCKSDKRPSNIPSNPNLTYKDKGWNGYKDFLGYAFLPFEEARIFVRKLKKKNQLEWNKYCTSGKKPINIPSTPSDIYKDKGWVNLGDFLGTGNVNRKEFIPFEEAREFIRSLNLKNINDWYQYRTSGEKPDNIPFAPHITYRNKGWEGMRYFLGTGTRITIEFLPFKEARIFVRKLKMKKHLEWKEYCKSGQRPCNIPSNPNTMYKDKGWDGFKDFLGID